MGGLWNLFSRGRRYRELAESVREHLAERVDELVSEGMARSAAESRARREFGNVTLMEERSREVWQWPRVESVWVDLKYASRQLRKTPSFTLTVLVTLALGIGANTAIFTLIHAVLLQALPVPHPEELYSLSDGVARGETGALQGKFSLYSYPLYRELRDNTPEFEPLAAYESAAGDTMSVRRAGAQIPDQHFIEMVSGNYFPMFGVNAFMGRALAASDDQPDAAPAAVMSYRVWQNSFQCDPNIIGKTLYMNGHPVTVAGVMPSGFFGDALSQNPTGFWMPLALEPGFRGQGSILHRWNQHWLMVVGRLRPGVRAGAVQAKLTGELQHWLQEQPIFDRQREALPRQHIEIMPASGGVSALRTQYAQRLKLLMALSTLVLLIACANVANMLLSRSASQRVQVAVQIALGASRWRILQQTASHGLLLAVLGGAAALGVSVIAARGILLLAFPGTSEIPISPWPSLPVLVFAFAVTLMTGLICSAAPAQLAMRTQPAQPLRGAGRSVRNSTELPQKLLVAAQAALSLVLLVATGLLLKSMQNLERQDFGFETEGRLGVGILRPLDQYKPEQLEGFYQNLEQRLKAIPGVVSASFSDYGPMEETSADEPVTIPGVTHVPQPEGRPWPDVVHVSADYFTTLGTKILRGRAIDSGDTPSAQHVAVVDQAFANLYFPNVDPLGKHFGILEAAHSGDYEIVGVAENAKYEDPHARPFPTFFLPLLETETYQDSAENSEQLAQNYVGSIQLQVRGTPQRYEEAVRRALAETNPDLTIFSVHSLADEVGLNLTQDTLLTSLTMLYGLLSLLLASVGLYGVASYAVARRTNEIGIRMALGAKTSSVLWMVMRESLILVAAGVGIGIPAALAAARLVSSVLYGLKASDPITIASSALVMTAVAALAGYLPARRAAKVDPMVALRYE